MKKATIILAIILLMSFMFTACGATQNSSTDTTSNSVSKGSSESKTESKTESQGKTESQSKRTDVNVVMPSTLGNLDPHDNTNNNSKMIFRHVFETLFFFSDKMEMSPRLAESYKVADDNVTYTIYLRKGVKFHNGDTFKASDVIFSLDHAIANPKVDNYCNSIKSYRAIDDYTIEIVSSAPNALFVWNLGYIEILNEKSVTEAGDKAFLSPETCIGTGPYYFTETSFEKLYALKAFPEYYRGEASIKEINYKVIADPSTALVAFESGEVDFITVPPANIKQLEDSNKHTMYMTPTAHCSYFIININKEPYNNKLIRQAMFYAINKEDVLLGAYDGYGEVAQNWAREGYIAHATNEGVNPYDYNPEKAKQLLAEAGYPNGIELGTIYAWSGNYFAKAAQIIQQNFADVGIKVSVTAVDQPALEDHIFWSKTFDMACYGTNVVGDSDFGFSNYFSDTAATAQPNLNPKLYELGYLGRSTLDPKERDKIYQEFWALVQDEATMLNMFHRYNVYASNPNLAAVVDVYFYNIYDWTWK